MSSTVQVSLTPRNLSKLRNGHVIQLKSEQIGGGSHTLNINSQLAKKMADAARKNKGVKIQLSAQEIEASGLRLRDVGRALKNAGKAYNRQIKPVVGPIIREAMTKALKVGLPAAAVAIGQPQLAAPAAMLADRYGEQAVNALGDATGGFGVKKSKRTRKPKKVTSALPDFFGGAVHYTDNPSGFLPAGHPALRPGNTELKDHAVYGGSFKMAGEGTPL